MSSCTLQPFPPCVRFTRHFCCLPWVFRVMLCVESSQPNKHGFRWLGVAGCGYACWVRLTATWWITSQLHPKRHTEADTPVPSPTQLVAVQGGKNNCPLPAFCMEINFNKPSQSSQQQQATERRKKKKKIKIHQGAKGGGGRKLSHSPLLSGSLFFPLCDLCPWPGPIHVPQIAQLMPQ